MPPLKPTRGILLNKSHHLARGLVACWLMNEGSADKICDLSWNASHGTANGDPQIVPGRFGHAIDFDGTNDWYDCGNKSSLQLSAMTVLCWAYIESNSRALITKGTSRSSWISRDWDLFGNGTHLLFIVCSTSANIVQITEGGFPSLNAWHQIVATWDGTTSTDSAKLYVDGVLFDAATATGTNNANRFNVYVGGYRPSGAYEFDGKIDHAILWNRALSAGEIAWLHREPFCMFERAITPGLIGGPIVNLAGTLAALSSLSATAKAIRKVSGTVASTSDVAALLSSIRGEESSLDIERSWLREALFNGMTANALKLGTTLSLGWFWIRVTGCSVLYRGPSIERIDFTNILTVAEQNACEISPPSYVPHNNSSIYFYVIRRFSNCGYQELTLAAAAKVSIDANGELEKPQPSNIFSSKAEQVDGNKIQLVWFYCPLEQKSQPVCFNVYYDGGIGQIDYENPLAKISYEGRRFYSCQSGALGAGGYLFTIRAEDEDGVENSSSAQLKIQLDTTNPDAIDILSTETV